MRNVIIGLIVAAVLAGAGWVLMGTAPRHAMAGGEGHGHMSDFYHGPVNQQAEVVQCPVMGTKFPAAKAYSSTVYKGKTYYFCCAMCPEKFSRDPEKYAK